MKPIDEIRNVPRLQIEMTGDDGLMGWAHLSSSKKAQPAAVVASWDGGWEHVSVSFRNRTPTWEEMAEVKAMFFRADEVCVEYHPAESEYVNMMPYCLHIWRPQDVTVPTPPSWMVGPKKGQTIGEMLKKAMEGMKK